MPTKFQPTPAMVDAATKVFMAMACVEIITPVVLAYQSQILKEGQWHIRPDMQEQLERRASPTPLETLVLDPSRSYMLSDEDFETYLAKCEDARIRAELNISQAGNCPLLEAENALRLARQLLVEEMKPVTNLTYGRLTSSSLAHLHTFVEMTLKLLAPFVPTSSESDLARATA